MQAYDKADLAPAEPDFNHQESHHNAGAAIKIAAEPQVGPGRSASSALAALILGELDEGALGVLAARLVPHLRGLDERNPAVAHAAYTVHSLAADLGVSRKAVRGAIARGELRAVKRGSRWIIPADAVSEWATPSRPRRPTGRGCSPRAPKAAGPSLRSVLWATHRGGS